MGKELRTPCGAPTNAQPPESPHCCGVFLVQVSQNEVTLFGSQRALTFRTVRFACNVFVPLKAVNAMGPRPILNGMWIYCPKPWK